MPEALKNLLLVMASRSILTEQWRVRTCRLHTVEHKQSVTAMSCLMVSQS